MIPTEGGPGSVNFHVKRLGKGSRRIPHKGNLGETDFLILRPSLHYSWVIDTIDDCLLYANLSESVLMSLIARNLLVRSSRGKCSRKSNDYNRPTNAVLGHINFFGVWKTFH